MKQATSSVTLPCDPETFWRVFLDPEYAKALYLGELGYRGLEVLESTPTTRKLRVVPKLNLPGPIASLIGDSFAYEDHGELDRARNVWTWRMVQPSTLPAGAKPKKNIVTTSGTIRIEPISERSCRRNDTLNIEANVFGLGGVIESTAEKEARAGWVKEHDFLRRRLAAV